MKSIQEVKVMAADYDSKLLATDLRFGRDATLIHRDGSVMHFNSAFLMRAEEWIVCFTEHHNFRIYHKDDLLRCWESEQRYHAIEELV